MECNPSMGEDNSVDPLLLNHIKVEVEMKQKVDVHSCYDSQIYSNCNTVKKEEDLDRGCSLNEFVIVETTAFIDEPGESLTNVEYNTTMVADSSVDPLLLYYIKVKQEDVHSLDDSQSHYSSNSTVTKDEDLDVGCSSSELIILNCASIIDKPEESQVDAVCMFLTPMKDFTPSEINTKTEIKQEGGTNDFGDFESCCSSHIVVPNEDCLDEPSAGDKPVVSGMINEKHGISKLKHSTRREHLSETLLAYKDNFAANKLYKKHIDSASSIGISSSDGLQINNKSLEKDNNQCSIRTQKSSKRYACSVCNKSFSHSSNLKKHKIIHSGSKPYKCGVCEKSFSQAGTLRVHERIHTGSKPYKCSFCEKTFSQSGTLRVHERTHTGSNPYKCSFCEKKFSVSSHLKIHERVHFNIKPYTCGSCGKSFSVLHNLKVHERTHSGSKLYICSFCGKSCSRLHDLKKHEGIHTGIKPYGCTFCEKKFSRSDDLKKHERIHMSKPYMCRFCKKQFSQENELKGHERIHTSKKPFQCSVCGKKFSVSRSLRRHERIHSRIKPYIPKVCNNNFQSQVI